MPELFQPTHLILLLILLVVVSLVCRVLWRFGSRMKQGLNHPVVTENSAEDLGRPDSS